MVGDTVLQYGVDKIYCPAPNEFWSVFGHKVLAYGLSGNLDAVPWINEMLAEGVDHHSCCPAVDNLVFHVILVTESRHAYSWYMDRIQSDGVDDSGLVPIHGPFAIGSGCQFALAVMAIGFSAEKAVEVASKLDTGTGGDVEVFSPPPKPAVLSTRPVPQQYVVDRFTYQETARELFDHHYKTAMANSNQEPGFDDAFKMLVGQALYKVNQEFPNWHGFSTTQLDSVKERVKALPKDMDVLDVARQTVAWLEEFKPKPRLVTAVDLVHEAKRLALQARDLMDEEAGLTTVLDEEEPMD